MYTTLGRDASRLPGLLGRALDASMDYLNSIDDRPPATDVARIASLDLPDDGLGAEQTLDLFARRYGHAMPASNGPRFWGFVTGGTTPAALVGDWLTSVYDLNLISAANSTAPDIEWEAIRLLRELFGLPATMDGTFVTGATMANFAGLAMGRECVARQFGKSVALDGLLECGAFACEFFGAAFDGREEERDERFGLERAQVASDRAQFAFGARRDKRDRGDGADEIALDREQIGQESLQLRARRA